MHDQSRSPQLPFLRFPGAVHLVENDEQLEHVVDDLNSANALGFDTETRPAFRKGERYDVALLQLATDDDAFLIRLHGITKFEGLVQVFENKHVLKVGAAIRDDLKALKARFHFTPQNFVELQHLAKEKNLENAGLRGMTQELLGHSLSKRAQTSNWEARVLTDDQLMYAATDAWVALRLYDRIRKLSAPAQ